MLKNIYVDLEKIMNSDTVSTMRSGGLDKVAAHMLKAEGIDIGESMTPTGAVKALGTKLFLKNAEYHRIRAGLDALKKLNGE